MTDLDALKQKFDLQSIEQLRDEVKKLAEENEQLQARLADYQEYSDQLHQDFCDLQLNIYPDADTGITKTGRLVVTAK